MGFGPQKPGKTARFEGTRSLFVLSGIKRFGNGATHLSPDERSGIPPDETSYRLTIVVQPALLDEIAPFAPVAAEQFVRMLRPPTPR